MNIGFDITALYVAQAGVHTYDYNLLQALLEVDHENAYLLLDYVPLHGKHAALPEAVTLKARNARIARCAGLRHRRLARWDALQRPPLQSLAALADRTLLWPWAAAAEASMRRNLQQALREVDVFHSSDVLLWQQPGALNVVTIYDLTALLFPEHHTPGTRELQARKWRFAREKADVVIAISEATKRDIVAHLGIPPRRIHVVRGGVGPAFRPIGSRQALEQALAPLRLAPGEYMLYVGTIEPRKNLERLVEAYHQVRNLTPAPKLVLAGARGWKCEGVFERVEALGLKDEVVFLGQVPDSILPALYNGAVAFAYPSLYEGFGLPPLEAMACGVPVIASDTSSLPEVVGDAGVLVDPDDTGALADALAALLSDDEKRAELSARGLARASAFSWEQTAFKTLEVYRLAEE
ncbi:MAG: glycosyltransferase family 4 protein [Anaerolineae bacterium]|nr:glycosyltransferase family 4 protein [Anaerolineae bacterium]